MSCYFFCEKQNWEKPRILLQIVLGSQLRTPVGEEEKELHRNSMRRELDSALKLSNLTDTSLGNNESCESLEVFDSLPDSPDKTARLATLMEADDVSSERIQSLTEKIPVTLNDPLGALSTQTSPMNTPVKQVRLLLTNFDMTYMTRQLIS